MCVYTGVILILYWIAFHVNMAKKYFTSLTNYM